MWFNLTGKKLGRKCVPEGLDAILRGSDKEWKLVHPCDVDHSSVVVDGTEMDCSSANTWLLK